MIDVKFTHYKPFKQEWLKSGGMGFMIPDDTRVGSVILNRKDSLRKAFESHNSGELLRNHIKALPSSDSKKDFERIISEYWIVDNETSMRYYEIARSKKWKFDYNKKLLTPIVPKTGYITRKHFIKVMVKHLELFTHVDQSDWIKWCFSINSHLVSTNDGSYKIVKKAIEDEIIFWANGSNALELGIEPSRLAFIEIDNDTFIKHEGERVYDSKQYIPYYGGDELFKSERKAI